MDETDLVRLEADSSIRVGTWGSVFQIALYCATGVAQLAAYLVVPAGEEFDFYKMIPVGTDQISVVEFCEFCILTWLLFVSGCYRVSFVLFFVADEPIFQMSFRWLWFGAAECPVSFVDLTIAEHRRQSFQRL